MDKVSILLVCAGGNSTSILVRDMQRNLKENETWHIDADAVENRVFDTYLQGQL